MLLNTFFFLKNVGGKNAAHNSLWLKIGWFLSYKTFRVVVKKFFYKSADFSVHLFFSEHSSSTSTTLLNTPNRKFLQQKLIFEYSRTLTAAKVLWSLLMAQNQYL